MLRKSGPARLFLLHVAIGKYPWSSASPALLLSHSGGSPGPPIQHPSAARFHGTTSTARFQSCPPPGSWVGLSGGGAPGRHTVLPVLLVQPGPMACPTRLGPSAQARSVQPAPPLLNSRSAIPAASFPSRPSSRSSCRCFSCYYNNQQATVPSLTQDNFAHAPVLRSPRGRACARQHIFVQWILPLLIWRRLRSSLKRRR